jgi:hypothetical protein
MIGSGTVTKADDHQCGMIVDAEIRQKSSNERRVSCSGGKSSANWCWTPLDGGALISHLIEMSLARLVESVVDVQLLINVAAQF